MPESTKMLPSFNVLSDVSPEGMIRVDKLLHSAKAPPSIKVRLGESVRLVKPSQIKNVLLVDYQYYTL